MRYAKVSLTFGPTNSYIFPLDSTISTASFVVKKIEGLDPPEVDVSIAKTLYEGGLYQGRRPQNRQIIMTLGFQPNYAIGENAGDLRQKLYDILTPKLGTALLFSLLDSSSTLLVSTNAYVSRIEAQSFTNDPDIIITMDCDDAFLKAPAFVHPTPTTIAKPVVITNAGNAPSGFEIKFTVPQVMSVYYIWTSGDGGSTMAEFLKFQYNFTTGDILQFSTIAGKRYASVVRAGVTTNLLPYKSVDSTWFQLTGGVNTIYLNHTGSVVQYLSYTPRYWGV